MENEQYKEIAVALKTNFEVMTRLDERVKSLVEKLHEFDERIKLILQEQGELTTRVGIIENRVCKPPCLYLSELKAAFERDLSNLNDLQSDVKTIENRVSHVERTATAVEDRWKRVFGFVFQALSTLLICWLLYRMGLQTPPLP